MTLIPDSSEKFVFFLKTVLDVLGVVLEFTTVSEIDLLCKNLLRFLHNFIVFLPIESVHCVKQVTVISFLSCVWYTVDELIHFYLYL